MEWNGWIFILHTSLVVTLSGRPLRYQIYALSIILGLLCSNAVYRNTQANSVNNSLSDFDWVFLEIPVKDCIVGMLLITCSTIALKSEGSSVVHPFLLSSCS